MSARAGREEAILAFVEHTEALRAEFDRRLTGHPVTTADVDAHHEWQRVETARFDGWLVERGWTRAELFAALREVVAEVRAADEDARAGSAPAPRPPRRRRR